MKCSACYADNAAWTQICVMCGQPVVAVELCVNGHILPPGSRECPICPSMWPEAPAFSGPPLLRGVLVLESGRIVERRTGAEQSFIEIRDGATPVTLAEAGDGAVDVQRSDEAAGDVRLLFRPDGIRICRKAAKMQYVVLSPGETLQLGGVRLRPIGFEVPSAVR